MQISGAEIVVRSLQEEGVELIFGYPGGSVLEIYDAIFKQNSFRHILVRHEQAAVHAADAYSRSSGRVGVALVTSGPGATNAVTGIASAYMDSIPLIVITGQTNTTDIGFDSFQEVDTVGITRPCVKHNFLVKDVKDLAVTIKKAFLLANSGRPGPVLIDIPKDVTKDLAEFSYPADINIRSYSPNSHGHSGQIKKAISMLLNAKRPMVCFGGGAVLSNADKELTELLNKLDLPCTGTLMGLGAYPGNNKNFLGMPGMHGTYEANMALQNCDVLLAVGVRFDDRVISSPEKFLASRKQIIHVDIDPSSISKRVATDVPIVGDVKLVLLDMLIAIQSGELNTNKTHMDTWWKQIEAWRSRNCLAYDFDDEIIQPQFVVEKLYEITGGKAIVTTDVGQHQMWAAQYYKFASPRRWLTSGGLGTMGVGLPYAMGAQLANPNEVVACITGEGSIQMNIQELSTCRQYHIPVKIINLNNRYLGMVRQWQELYYGNRYSESYMDALPDFVKLAEAYGHIGIRIERPSEVEPALLEALSHKDRLVFLDVLTNREANVYPMVGNGKGLDEMVLPPHMNEQAQKLDDDRDYDNLC